MQRRNLLKTLAALALQPIAWSIAPALAAQAAKARALLRRVRPTDAAWPDAAKWQGLNDAVGGKLVKAHSLFAPCVAEPGGADCADVIKNIRNPFYVGDQPAGTQVSGWLDAWTPAPPAYAVAARHSSDVAAAVNFAREHQLRLAVKGTGHSYQGTSIAADSLLIWTRAMNQVTLHDKFVAEGCEATQEPVAAVTTESGAVWIDLYNAVTTEAGRYVQGGGCADVGVAGLVQSGGFGSLSKAFGSAAASLLQAEVVTADGQVRIANPCRNPDLFWALKGGGGGSWGVVTKLTLRTHELPEFFGAAWGKIKAQSDDAFRKLIARFVAFYAESLFNPHWGESVKIAPDNTLEVSMVCQGLDKEQAPGVWQSFFDWVKASPGEFSVADNLGARATQARGWWDPAGRSMTHDPRPDAPKHHSWWNGDQGQVGAYIHGYDSTWLSTALLRPERQQVLADALFAASRHKKVELHFNKGLAGAPADALQRSRDTATNPLVLDAFALAIIADGERPAYPGLERPAIDLAAAHGNARAIDRAIAELRTVAPKAGSYVSESNFFNASWRTEFWGGNYAKLRAIKAKYDPDCLFFVHHGVGSEDWSDDGFRQLHHAG